MTWTARLLRGADDLNLRPFEPCTTAATFIVDTCGETGVTAYDVVQKFAASDTAFGYRVAQGRTAEVYDSTSASWLKLDPVTTYGPMLVRTVSVTEHEGRDNLWRLEYEATGFGPAIDDADPPNELGSPNVSVSTASRPRTANAYRMSDPDPTGAQVQVPPETPAAGATYFARSDWHTGVDIGGVAVDVNTSPLPVPIDQTVITVNYVARWHYQEWDGTYSGRVNLYAANDLVGGRNLCEFMQYPVGSLLFESIDVQPLHHEFKAVTLVFVYDEWHHAQQVPLTLPQFSTPVDVDTTTAMSQTKTVLWIQPYLDGWCIDSSTDWLDAATLAYLERFEAEP